jgi:TatD DNase family protein
LADDIGSELEFIKSNIDKCVAVGEVGLDYWIERDRNLQRRALREVLQLAAEYNKPVILHSRGAWEDAFELVKAAALERVVFHWYSGPLDILRQILDHGYCISATPAAEYSRSHRRAIATAPLERIVLETDSPVNYRGLEARPVHVLRTLDAVAELKDVPAPEVAEITTRTAFALFRL